MRIVFSYIFLLFIFGVITANAQQKMVYKFAVFFNNKDTVTYPISNPELYLSAKSIARKQQQNIGFDMLDVPVNSINIKAIQKKFGEIQINSFPIGNIIKKNVFGNFCLGQAWYSPRKVLSKKPFS